MADLVRVEPMLSFAAALSVVAEAAVASLLISACQLRVPVATSVAVRVGYFHRVGRAMGSVKRPDQRSSCLRFPHRKAISVVSTNAEVFSAAEVWLAWSGPSL